MIDERDLLERALRAFEPQPGLTDRVYRRRDRKRRNQRIGAGALAIIIALVSFVALTRAFRTAERPADQPTPAPSPVSLGALAYGVDGDIYVAEWDGSNAVRIADGVVGGTACGPGEYRYWGEGPIWSPDGRYLAYRRGDCGGPDDDVVISDREGNIVASFPSESWLISWSPDSTRVATFVDWGRTIGVYGLDGERQMVLTLPPGLMAPGDFDPVWSRDGASLLVPHGVVVPLDGSTPHELPPDDPRSKDATYSPVGSLVAYITHGSLVVANADGSEARNLSRGLMWDLAMWDNLAWSPTGDRIAFVYQTSETDGGYTAATELRVVDVASGTVTRLAGMGETDIILSNPQFSPEGNRILFSRTEDKGRRVSSLWSINADGSDPRRLVTGTGWGEWHSLSPTP
jgi:Tol biopolymer transport system component